MRSSRPFAMFLLLACASWAYSDAVYDGTGRGRAVTTANGQQLIETPFGTARFSTPRGWSLSDMRAAQPGFTLAPSSDWRGPHIFTSCVGRTDQPQTKEYEDWGVQEFLQEQAVQQYRDHDFSQAGVVSNDVLRLPHGREIHVYLRVLNTPELVAFIPEKDCYVEVTLKVMRVEEFAKYRAAFDRFLKSYSFDARRTSNQTMEPTASRRTTELYMIANPHSAATRALARGSSSCSR